MRKFIIAFITIVIALGATGALADTDYLTYRARLDQTYLQMLDQYLQTLGPRYRNYKQQLEKDYIEAIDLYDKGQPQQFYDGYAQQLAIQEEQELQQYKQAQVSQRRASQRQQEESMQLQRQGTAAQQQQADATTKIQAQEERNVILAGTEAYNKQDYATTVQLWRPLAEQGNVNAQLGLGLLYQRGQGVPQNNKRAQYWLCQAVKQGNTDAAESISKAASGTANPNADVVASVYCGQ